MCLIFCILRIMKQSVFPGNSCTLLYTATNSILGPVIHLIGRAWQLIGILPISTFDLLLPTKRVENIITRNRICIVDQHMTFLQKSKKEK